MIAIDDRDLVHRLETADGRFLLFTSTDLPKGHPLPWWGVTFDTGGDGHGILLVPGPTGLDAWTGLDLIEVLIGRAEAELNRRLAPHVSRLHDCLRRAALLERQRHGPALRPEPRLCRGPNDVPYGWATARRGDHLLPLCSDPESFGEGIAPAQLLYALAQLYDDAVTAKLPIDPTLPHLLAAAAEAEDQRVKIVRRQQKS